LDQHTAELQRVRAEVRAEVIETERSQRELDEQLAEINRMISDARHRLALPARGEDDDE
jgi:hypothetical protein